MEVRRAPKSDSIRKLKVHKNLKLTVIPLFTTIVLFKYCGPECDHRKKETEIDVSKKDSLKNIKTNWISGNRAELKRIDQSAEKYQIAQLEPLAIGKETINFLVSFDQLQLIPYAAFYSENQLIKTV
ncbi:MAG: hypothetical protein AAF843_08950 [Bacteroidota bacterium]